MKNKYPLVSVVIPNYNKEKYISDTLQSIINQTYANWETIVVDDGSTDNSCDIVKQFEQKCNKVKLYTRKKKTKGGSVCRNIGISLSKGKYIIFLDSDDILMPNTIKNRVEVMEKYNNLDFAVFSVGHFYYKVGDCNTVKIPKIDEDHLYQFITYNIPWHTTSPIWKKSFLYQINLFNEAYPRLQDVELHTKALAHKSVKYQVFTMIDFYQRLDPDRTVIQDTKRVYDMYQSFLLYIIDTGNIIDNMNEKYSSALRLTIKKALHKISTDSIPYTKKTYIIYSFLRKLNEKHIIKFRKKYILLLHYLYISLKQTIKNNIKK